MVPEGTENEKWGNDAPFPRKRPYQLLPDGGNTSAFSIVQKLIKDGKQNERMHNGWTWLHTAILNGDGDAVKLLIDHGADINAKANDGWTPLDMAAATFAGNHEKTGRLKDYTKYDIFKMVLAAGADINATTTDGWTPLHAAVANAMKAWREDPDWSLNRIRDLLHAGADVEARDMNGRTPLHWAALQGFYYYTWLPEVHSDVVKLLLDKGAEINSTDKFGKTPLHYAVEMGYRDIVLELVTRGADLSKTDNKGETPADIAERTAQPVISYILENGKLPAEEVSEGTQNPETDTTGLKYGPELLKASWEGDLPKVKELLEKGADVYYRDSDGFSAMDRARDNGHKEIVGLLKKAGAGEK